MKRKLLALLLALVTILSVSLEEVLPCFTSVRAETAQTLMLAGKKKKNTPTPKPSTTPRPSASPTAAPAENPDPTVSPVPEGPIIDPQSIADFIFANGRLPDNFITKEQARELGWDSRFNYVSDVAPGYSIGGDYFGNYEGRLPRAKGRKYYECDCWYESGKRNAYRIIFSNDGLVFYTEDHYETFTEMHPSVVMPSAP